MSNVSSSIVLLQPYLAVIAAILLGIASLSDVATRTIPDLVPVGLVVIGIVIRLADGSTVIALTTSTAVLLLGALCWRFGWLGGGDVKLLAACAWLVPPALVPQLVLLTALAGGVLACVYLALSRITRTSQAELRGARPRSIAKRIWRAERWRIRRRSALPYGCAIAVATLLILSGW